MAQTVTASVVNSGITDGQIASAKQKLDDAMRKHRDEITTDVMQQVLGVDNFGMRLFAIIRDLARDISGWTIHVVAVNRTRSPKDALKASGRTLYVTDSVVEAMPRGVGDNPRLVYFKPDASAYKNGWLSCDALAEEYAKRGLVPDPQAQIDDNAANPEFADTTPNACQWKDADGNYCCATFGRWFGERRVHVHRRGRDWGGGGSFAGVPQVSSGA